MRADRGLLRVDGATCEDTDDYRDQTGDYCRREIIDYICFEQTDDFFVEFINKM